MTHVYINQEIILHEDAIEPTFQKGCLWVSCSSNYGKTLLTDSIFWYQSVSFRINILLMNMLKKVNE